MIVCLFSLLAQHLHRKESLKEQTSTLFNLFLEKIGETDPANFRGVCIENIAAVEDFVQIDLSLYEIVDGSMVGERGRRSVGKLYDF